MGVLGCLLGIVCLACIVVGQIVPGPLQHFSIQPVFRPQLPWLQTGMPVGRVHVAMPPLQFPQGILSSANKLAIMPSPVSPGITPFVLPPSLPTGNLHRGNLMSFVPNHVIQRPPLSPLPSVLTGGGLPPFLPAPVAQRPVIPPPQGLLKPGGGLPQLVPPAIIQRPLLPPPPRILPIGSLPQLLPSTIIQRPLNPLPPPPRVLPIGGFPQFLPPTAIQRSMLPPPPRVLPIGGLPQLVPPIKIQRPLLPPQPRVLPRGVVLNVVPQTVVQRPLLPQSPRVLPGGSFPQLVPPFVNHKPLSSPSPRVIPGGLSQLVQPVARQRPLLPLPLTVYPRGGLPQVLPQVALQRSSFLPSPPRAVKGLPPFVTAPLPSITRPPIVPSPHVIPNIRPLPLPVGPQSPLGLRLPLPHIPFLRQAPVRMPNSLRPLPHQQLVNSISPLPLPLRPIFGGSLQVIRPLPRPMRLRHSAPLAKLFPLPKCKHSLPMQSAPAIQQPIAKMASVSMLSSPRNVIMSLLGGIAMAGNTKSFVPMNLQIQGSPESESESISTPSNLKDEQSSTTTGLDPKVTESETGQRTAQNNELILESSPPSEILLTKETSPDQEVPTQQETVQTTSEQRAIDTMELPLEKVPRITKGLDFLLQKKSNSRF